MNKDPKFAGGIYINRPEDAKVSIALLNYPIISDFKAIVEDYLRILRIRFENHRHSIFNLQIHILLDIAFAEQQIRAFKDQKRNLKNDEELLGFINDQIRLYSLFRERLKDIGDALAWKFFNYDRSIIYCCSENNESGFLQPDGIAAEMGKMAVLHFVENKLPLMTAITHCLRIGDIIMKDSEGNYNIAEIKSDNSGGTRRSRQKRRIDNLVSLLNNKEIEKKGKLRKIIALNIYPSNYFEKILSAFDHINKKTIEVIKLNEFTYVDIVNHFNISDSEHLIGELKKAHSAFSDVWDRKSVMVSSFDRYKYSRIIAPYTIFPFSERICSDIMFGVIAVYLRFNFTLFELFLNRYGCNVIESAFDVKLKGKTSASTYIYKISFKNMEINISANMLMKLLFEFSSPKLFVKEIEAIYEHPELNGNDVMVINQMEKEIWK